MVAAKKCQTIHKPAWSVGRNPVFGTRTHAQLDAWERVAQTSFSVLMIRAM